MYGAWSWGFKTKRKTWKEVVREDCQARKLNKEDAMDRCKWRKVIKEARWSGWVWVGECFLWYRPTRVVPDQRPLNGCCCCWLPLTVSCFSKIPIGFTFLVPAHPGSPGKRAVKQVCVCVCVCVYICMCVEICLFGTDTSLTFSC